MKPRTQLIHAGTKRSAFDETSEALYLTSGYVYESAEECEAAFKNDGSRFIYSRFGNPTTAMFEERMAAYEGAEKCFATASGMAAVFASLMCQLKAGDRIVAPRALFGSCLIVVSDICVRFGVECTLVDGTDNAQWEEALARKATVVFLESPSNPTLQVVDIRKVCKLAHAAGARVVVDNVFATPVLQKPLELGADVVVYSATKHIDGQGRVLGGAILCDSEFAKLVMPFVRHTGPAMSPFNAWVLLKGLETMELRVRAQSHSALTLARHLEKQARVSKVGYVGLESHPQYAITRSQMQGGSSIVALHLEGDKAAAFRFMNALELVSISNNLGDSKSLVTHPATTTHHRLTPEDRLRVGITDATMRLSVGLEDTDDIIEDVMRALATV